MMSARMRQVVDGTEWWLTAIYGPTRDQEKQAFLDELHELQALRSGPWLLAGDFNLIYRA
jgi:endonuclease/exonuclease/phosphatase (EEP) superfamily protein YafD